ncbi:efflux RND transporter periplasmic adaptor subunit [Rhodobacteraceae bacterium RKSG542]|uniref:efflux RND transporter periplasmic adaptor subunit n=1 Tax=Pseudovibrio flavus TaxID=2529854 RepID=UPI0012BD0734|nr:efflux RND transporter periplasmic adaptor subunit [Pseudovibrio flavus]MTI15759.1 efflux RND transporter periplasmic adaptor subunit [Pseudovibrio flavus]
MTDILTSHIFRFAFFLVQLSLVPAAMAQGSHTFVGSLQSAHVQTVVSKVSGTIETVGYRIGERIRADHPLITIGSEEYQLTLKAEQANAEFALADLNYKKAKLERVKQLEASATFTRDQRQNVEADYLMAEATYSKALIACEQAKLDYENTIITAATSYWVAERTVEIGDWVEKGSKLLSLERLDELKAVIFLSEHHLAGLEVGQNVSLSFEASAPPQLATISTIGLKPTSGRRAYLVEIKVDNRNLQLRPGFTVDVTIPKEIGAGS